MIFRSAGGARRENALIQNDIRNFLYEPFQLRATTGGGERRYRPTAR